MGIFKKTRLFLHKMVQEILFVDAMADAVAEGSLKRINLLVFFGADVNHVSQESVVENDDTARGGIRRTILSRGEGYSHTSGISTATFLHLVKKGMDPNQTCMDNNNFLARNLRSLSCDDIRNLVKAGVDPNFKTRIKQRPLSFWLGNIVQVNMFSKEKTMTLIDCGMDINAQDIDGNTFGHIICIQPTSVPRALAVDHGLRLDIKNNKGETPVDVAHKVFGNIYPVFVQGLQAQADLGLKMQLDSAVRQAAGGLTEEHARALNDAPALIVKKKGTMRLGASVR